ncbi:helix-turn-helix transcriptional regulator [Desertihabitans aurantiacus]|uniref:helix-turn-helix transcriptional regulator n=1 Tax=Desertihabitans aurantiacus TaxID=2282477 RepID=UPI000DF7278C|nr:helix-turn-helix transcriptional regulator [Desertihabitans aurantiacus]
MPRAGPDFAAYLRSRRALVPVTEQVPRGRRSTRRVPGLRRQELADAAAISVEYYTRLEQGRAPHPSREVLAALAQALRLLPAERDHLFRLAGEPPPVPAAPQTEVRPGLSLMLQTLDRALAVTVHDGRLDLLARNTAAEELLGPLPPPGRFSRNLVHQAFTPPTGRMLGEDGAAYARFATAELRSALARYPEDDYLRALQRELSATSADFREHWSRGEVGGERSMVKRLRDPQGGWTVFRGEVLHDAERDHWVVIYTPDPSGSPEPVTT